MKNRSKIISLTFEGGVNNTKDPTIIDNNQMQKCLNFYVSNQGRLISRPGMLKIYETTNKVVFIDKFNNDIYYALDNGDIYKANTKIGTCESGNIYFKPAFGKLWITDGGKLKYWDGVNFGTIDDFIYFNETIAVGDGTTTTFNYTTKNIPVSYGSVSIYYTIGGISYTANDDGNGNISGNNLSGTVDYSSGSISLTFSTAPDNGINIDIRYSISEVLDIQADFIEFRQERLWLAKGDTLYYSEIRDPSRWFFIKINSKDESEISAISQIYDKLIIFKEGKDRGIFVLSGNSEPDFTVSLITKGVSTKQKSIVNMLGDLFFLDGGQLYRLSTVVEYGDVKPISINQNFYISDGDYCLVKTPIENVIFAFNGKEGFTYNPTLNAFTSLNSEINVSFLTVIENQVYIGGENGVLVFADKNTDDNKKITYFLSTKIISNLRFYNSLIKRTLFFVSGIDDGVVNISVFRKGKGYNFNTLSIFKASKFGIDVWDTAKWSNISIFPIPKRQVIYGDYIYFSLISNDRSIIESIVLEVA